MQVLLKQLQQYRPYPNQLNYLVRLMGVWEFVLAHQNDLDSKDLVHLVYHQSFDKRKCPSQPSLNNRLAQSPSKASGLSLDNRLAQPPSEANGLSLDNWLAQPPSKANGLSLDNRLAQLPSKAKRSKANGLSLDIGWPNRQAKQSKAKQTG
jgi:hypothetical protein